MTIEMPWFKLWDEAGSDEKLDSLTPEQFRVWFKLMCVANRGETRGGFDTQTPRLLALKVSGGDVPLLRETLQALEDLSIVSICDDGLARFINWEKRQSIRPSDTRERVAERQRQHRARQREALAASREIRDLSRESRDGHESNSDFRDRHAEKRREEERRGEESVTPLTPLSIATRTREDAERLSGDKWARAGLERLRQAYPQHRLGDKRRELEQFCDQIRGPDDLNRALANLEVWKTSEEWQRGVINNLVKWLAEGKWRTVPPPHASPNGHRRMTQADHNAPGKGVVR